jgi:hypothetical protein
MAKVSVDTIAAYLRACNSICDPVSSRLSSITTILRSRSIPNKSIRLAPSLQSENSSEIIKVSGEIAAIRSRRAF